MAKKILIVDDEEILTKSFSILLRKNGYTVFTARNGRDAEMIAKADPLDLVICDMRMPGINGVGTIRMIRSTSAQRHQKDIPVIFITGFADENLEEEAKELNPVAYLYKPFDNARILEVIRKALLA